MKYLFLLLLTIIFQLVYGGEIATTLNEDAKNLVVPDKSSLEREKRQYHHGGYPNHGYDNVYSQHYGNGYGLQDYGMMSPYQMYPNPADTVGLGGSGMGRGGMLNTLMTPFNMFGSMLGLRSANFQNQMHQPVLSEQDAGTHYPIAWPHPHTVDTDYKQAVPSDQSVEPVAAYIMSTPNRMQYIYQ